MTRKGIKIVLCDITPLLRFIYYGRSSDPTLLMVYGMPSPTPSSEKGFGHGSYTSPVVEKQSSRLDASISKWSSILSVLVAGMALFSDG